MIEILNITKAKLKNIEEEMNKLESEGWDYKDKINTFKQVGLVFWKEGLKENE